jgi:hypothetical protein
MATDDDAARTTTADDTEPVVPDDDYRRGIVVGDHTGRSDWHRFATPRVSVPPSVGGGNGEQPCAGDPQASDRAVRNRLLYRVPLNVTGRYRDRTGQTTRFAIY